VVSQTREAAVVGHDLGLQGDGARGVRHRPGPGRAGRVGDGAELGGSAFEVDVPLEWEVGVALAMALEVPDGSNALVHVLGVEGGLIRAFVQGGARHDFLLAGSGDLAARGPGPGTPEPSRERGAWERGCRPARG